MSATSSSDSSHAGGHSAHGQHDLTHCENCKTPLHGHYCYECGQSVVNPIRHVGHALEEVFESFWHLDGRIFRTLRDLLSPGRVARNYIAGHRVRYVAPLRLFVIVSVLTFFVAKFAIHIDETNQFVNITNLQEGTVRLGNSKSLIRRADSIAEVEEVRARTLKELQAASAQVPAEARGAIDKSIQGLNRQADKRIDTLRMEMQLDGAQVAAQKAEGQRAAATSESDSINQAKTLAEVESARDARIAQTMQDDPAKWEAQSDMAIARGNKIRTINAEAGCRIAQLQREHAVASEGANVRKSDFDHYGEPDCDDIGDPLSFNGKPWSATTNPLIVTWWPKFANDWLNKQVGRGEANIKRLTKEPWLYVRAMISAVPTALFLMVPLFALLLKLAYLGSGRGYLEHLAIALYSHVYLCLLLLAMFVLMLLGGVITPHWSGFGWISGLGIGLLWTWMPIYLLIMQKRVYGNGWPLTLIRYTVVGSLYFVLMSMAAVFLAISAIVQM
ncbi:DUF3667 domain-containing protein [Lysobacter gummosus]|uniref:DUF3667 domain-containing protein n=1 Tax=Lysobacter gummosus TaxID=262324 RepID=A0ABY3X9T2_9GAMM|nr:DUF3667 domain-containing protein [Lysobacter gummosus]ALN93888.1 hypothetical protein LG3211_4955 [Lysobacter gummosus]UNP29338.1 DUF3667 domain-containing protein [Lysobacter gummosus]